MRARRFQDGKNATTSSPYVRAQPAASGRSFHLITAIFLLIGLIAPFVTLPNTLAAPVQPNRFDTGGVQQQDNTPPPLQGVFAVSIGGDVANQVGPLSLNPSGDGFWTGVAALGPGSYGYQLIVSTNFGDVVLGENGLESPPANQANVTVPDGAQAAFFSFNENTGELSAGGLVYEVVTEVGQFSLAPDGEGNFEVFFNATPGTPITIQPIAFGQPTGETGQVTADDSGRVHVVLNANGQIQTAEAVQTATLTILKSDQAGNPLPGACFAAYGGGQPVSAQACDATDGNEDGFTLLRFPNGLPDADVDIVESFTPDGQPVSEPQEIDVQFGDNQIVMIAQAAEAEEPAVEEPTAQEPQEDEPPAQEPQAEEPAEPTAVPEGPVFTLTFFAVDLNGAALPGACFAIDGGEPFCDDDGDGAVIIPNVPAGPRTLSEPQSPQGFEAYPDVQLEITRDEQFSVPHNPGAGPALDETSTIELVSVDEDGNPLPSACYALDNGAQACDDDGDGTTVFTDVANGSYSVSQTQTPEGFAPVAGFGIDVAGDESFQVPHQTAAEPEPEEPDEPGEPGEPEEPGEFSVGFVSVDANQNGLPFACYTIDGGAEQCDDDGDAIVTFDNVAEGAHTLTQTVAPEGFENVGSLEIIADGDQNFAVRHEAAPESEEEPEEPAEEPTGEPTEETVEGLTVGFVSVDPDDNGLPGACFQLDDGEEQCDDDGDAEVTFTGVQPGPHVLTETQPPDGYETVGSLDLDLQNDGRFAIRHQAAEGVEEPVEPEEPEEQETPPAEPGVPGEIVATTVDQDGNELPLVCYQISSLGEQCDGDDEDNAMSQSDVVPGDYTIELVIPEGYETAGDTSQTVTVGEGESVAVEFQVQLAEEGPGVVGPEVETDGAGAIQAVATEDGFPIIDACIQFDGPASGEVCDNQEGDDNPEQGAVLISGLPAGDYLVAMPNPPQGFDAAPAVEAAVADGETTSVEVPVAGAAPEEPTATAESTATLEPTVAAEPTATSEPTATPTPEPGNLTIVKTDPEGAPLAGACFQIGDVFEVCDNLEGDADGQDGVIRVEGLAPGNLSITETVPPEGYLVADPVTVTVEAGGEAQLQVVNQLEPPVTGAFRVVKRDPEGTRITGACFALVGAEETLGPWCDGGPDDVDDRNGVMEIQNIPIGDYTLTESEAPVGFLPAADQPVTILEGERTGVVIVNEFANGSLAITKIDADGNPFAGACFTVGNALGVCDNGEDDGDPEEGSILLASIPAGTYTVAEEPVAGFEAPDPQEIVIVGGETAQLSFVNVPSSGTLQIQKTDETGSPLGGACFSAGELTVCDNDEGDSNEETGIIEVSGVAVGSVEVTETSAPEGYAAVGETQTIDVAPNETATAVFTNTRLVGAVSITKTNDAGDLLGGACFTVGGQTVCDNDEGDGNEENGIVDISNVPVGPVEILESTVPEGYAGSDSQTIDVANGETSSANFVNTQLVGGISITKTNESGEPLGGACFTFDGQNVCDNEDGDGNDEAGIIEISGVPVGSVEIVESSAPEGFAVSGDPQTVEVVTGEIASATFSNIRLIGAVSIIKSDESGVPLGGACFSIGGQEVCDNDEVDENAETGFIELSGVPVGSVEVSETTVPEGYSGSDPQTVDVADGETVTATFTNNLLVGAVSITKTDENGEPLGGACFSVGEQTVCDNQEGDGNDETGIIDIGGVPVGSVTVTESTVPDGYSGSGPETVEVGPGETAPIAFTNTRLVGSIQIQKTDAEGNPFAGACFTIGDQVGICDNDEADGDPEDGSVLIEAIPTGSYSVAESPIEGFVTPDPQNVEITSGETAQASFVNVPDIGAVAIQKTDEEGVPLGGACFSVGGRTVCDNAEGDENDEAGAIVVSGVATGSVEIVETTAPEGYGAGESQTGEVVLNETTTVTFTNTLLVGTIQIQSTDEQGVPLGGACFSIAGRVYCDNQDDDSNEETGFVQVSDVQVGSVQIAETTTPEDYAPGGAQTIEVVDGETTTVNFTNTLLRGAIRIEKTNEAGEPLGGACFIVDGQDVCDNGEGDENEGEGTIEVSGIAIGPINVTETTAPEGYVLFGETQSIEIIADDIVTLTVVNIRSVGGISIVKTDEAGEPLGGSCFTIGDQEVCDNGEGDESETEGTIEVSGVPTGPVSVTETVAPDGFVLSTETRNVEVTSDAMAPVTVVNVRAVGVVSIVKTDETGEPLGGSCFAIGDQEVCDNGEGDQNDAEGTIEVLGIPTGPIAITETVAPDGYVLSTETRNADVTADTVAQVTIANIRAVGGVSIVKTDEAGEPLGGSCFTIGDQEVCDNGEGDENDDQGTIEVSGILTGPVAVTETTAPEGYVLSTETREVQVTEGALAPVTVVNVRAVGVVSIVKTDETGEPLGGSCFTIGDQEVCDNGEGDENDAEGTIEVGGIPTGSVAIAETVAPDGYVLSTETRNVGVTADSVAQVMIANIRAVGGVSIVKTDEAGEPLGGSCFTIGDQEVCDNGEGDENDDQGTIEVSGILTGPVAITETTAPEGYVLSTEPREVQVTAATMVPVTVVNVRAVGGISITKADETGEPLGGSCFTIGDQEVCDNGEGDENDAEGTIEVSGIPTGPVAITETVAPDGYVLSGVTRNVGVTADSIAQLTVMNVRETGGVLIVKTDQTGESLGGSCFTIGDQEICDNGEGDENDAEGTIEVSGIPTGPVAITETTAPDGYILAAGSQTLDVTVDAFAPLTVVNTRAVGGVSITKTDEVGEPLGGSCFTIGDQEVCDNGEIDENDTEGVIEVSGILTGPLGVSETVAPDGYVLSTATEIVEVTADSVASLTVANVRAIGGLSVTKTDEAGEPLGGSCFTIGDLEVCDNGEGDENDAEGVIEVSGILTGPVSVTESVAPEGYVLSTASQTVDVTGDSVAPLTVVNTRAVGIVSITKTDEASEPLGESCFTISDLEVCDNGDGDENDTEGIIEVSGIPTGSVAITETAAPGGYVLSTETRNAVVAANSVAELTVVNVRAVGGVSISKTDEAGEPLGGSCFTIGDQEICDNGEGDENDAEGVIEVGGIPTGPVTVTESVAPDGYVPSTQTETVDITTNSVASLTVTNVRATGGVSIAKTDETGAPLGGSCFTIGSQEVCDNSEGDENDAEGTIEVSGVPTGPVDVSETIAPDGYVVSTEPRTVEITADVLAPVTVVNIREVGSISIAKTDEADEPLAGACFELEGTAFAVCDNDESDAEPDDGLIRIDGIPTGDYQLIESQAPEGFEAGGPVAVAVATGDVTTVTVENSRQTGSIRIFKADAEDGSVSLAGACFSVSGGEPVCDNGEGDVDPAEGLVEIANVPAGTHEVTETTPPEDYVAGAPVTVEVPIGAAAEITITNQRAEGTIRIEKTDDATGELLAGACFSIDGGEPVCDNDVNDGDPIDGVLLITATPGERSVAETQAPAGFDAVSGPGTVTVPLGETVTLTVANTQFAGSVRIAKIDNLTDEPLADACFIVDGVESTYGPICDNGTGDGDPAEGSTLIQGIEPGTYTITESTTPAGFVIPAGPVAEGVLVSGGEVTDVTVVNELEGAATLEPVELGGISITKTGEEGALLGGACFALSGDSNVGPICDDQAGDVNPEPGVIGIEGIPSGSYTLEETIAPEGFSAGSTQPVEVQTDQVTAVNVVNSTVELETGSLRIRTTDADGGLQGGACFSNGIADICDNDPGDEDPVPGEILVSGLNAGEYTITETEPPGGFALADPRGVTIEAGQEALLEIEHEAAPVETGGLEFELNDPNGNPVEGACVALSSNDNQAEDLVACDGGDLDTNPDPGALVVQDLPVGVYSVSQASVPGEESAQVAGVSFRMAVQQGDEALNPTQLQAVSEKTVQVKANVIIVIIIIIIIDAPKEGSLEIIKRSEDANVLQPGACFEITGQGNTIEICDNDGVDANLTNGVIRFLNLAEGIYSISETESPPGYDPAPDQDAAVVGGMITTITIKDPPTPDPFGSLVVLKVDPEGTLIPGACFELRQGQDVIAGPVCDDEDGDDGAISFLDLVPGDYTLRETQAASPDYQPVADQPVTVVAGQELEIPVVNQLKPGSILIVKQDEEGDGPLAGACFGLDRGSSIEFEVCDQQPGDGDLEEGIILISAVPPGEYTLIETVAPAGFDAGLEMDIEVELNTQLMLEIENTPSVPPVETGDLTILKRDINGDPLPGACFALRQGPVIKVAAVCDNNDGANDGTITFEDVGAGQYGVIETQKPSADYLTTPEKFVTITSDQNTTVVIVNVLKRGRILVQKVNQQDQPLANACFKVTPGIHAIKCTDGSGNAVFDYLQPGVYTVAETQAPYGYLSAPPVTNIVVKPGLTSPVKIVNKKAPPPPDAGSLRVIKFFCPLLGQATDLTKVYDSSDAGQTVLSQTANCKKGDATFVLRPNTPGDIISIKFVTGPDGIAHLTLPSGVYTLTEQSTKVAVEVRVFVAQQTTVVVLNYIPPPPPAPVRINVYKYTCDPGFEGQYYLDFIGGCGTSEALTNSVTFRISGAAIASRVTGDGGERGRTLFSQLPSGLYTLKEDVPAGGGTTYMWCGLTLEGSEYGAIASQISFPLSSGQTMYCAAFNVPDDVTDATGSIVVQKYACELPQVKRPANFDWFGECGLQGTGVKFSLSELLDGVYVPKVTGVSDINGILKFNDLRPGTYKLQEVGADWCHAESDSVNVDGDVLVRAGERSSVWIFNCVPTVKPPNTGAGTTAGLVLPGTIQTPEDTNSAASLAVWPLLALAGLAARRKWMTTRAV